MKLACKKISILLALSVGGCVGYFLLHQGKQVEFSGIVIDAETGLPIPQAKIVITTFPYALWDASPTNTGSMTKNDGSFSIVAKRDYWISGSTIGICSPDNLYLREECELTARDQLLRLHPLPERLKNIDAYSYKNFSGGWSGEVCWEER